MRWQQCCEMACMLLTQVLSVQIPPCRSPRTDAVQPCWGCAAQDAMGRLEAACKIDFSGLVNLSTSLFQHSSPVRAPLLLCVSPFLLPSEEVISSLGCGIQHAKPREDEDAGLARHCPLGFTCVNKQFYWILGSCSVPL